MRTLLSFASLFFAVLSLVTTPALAQTSPPSKPLPTTPEQWTLAAQQDVRAATLITAENHPGYVDPANRNFKRLLTQAESNGLALARQVKDAAGYVAAIRRFSNTLQDGHAGAYATIDQAQLPKPRWPGFVAVWRGDAMFVYNSLSGGPPKGARITRCDGTEISALVRRNVFTFRGRPSEPGNWWTEARRVFVDSGNPFIELPKVCTFFENGRSVQRSLTWRESDATFNQWRDDSYNGVTLPVGLTKRGGGLVWIAMPTFEPDEAQQAGYRAIMAQIAAERDVFSASRAIVLDLRDNQGGSSEWSKQIAEALWGQANLNRRLLAYNRGATSVLWRTSNSNARYVEATIPQIIAQGMPALAADWTRTYQGMDQARARGEVFFKEPDEVPTSASTPSANVVPDLPPMRAPVYVIVPGQCASACLDALDVFTRFENVKLIGAPSSADSTYMEVRSQDLPSGLGAVIIPNKVYVGRPRGAGVAYRPAIEVRDIDWSTEKFEVVVLRDLASG